MGIPIGIDLGTSNSCAAAVVGGKPIPAREADGSDTTPSFLWLTEEGNLVVGRAAKEALADQPSRCIYASKRLIGRAFDAPDVKKATKHLLYKVVPGPNGDARIEVCDRTFSPVEVAALILKRMRANAERSFKGQVDEAVITVPAYFNDGQRQATKDAGQVAGLQVLRLINEPTAAALAYGFGDASNARILVYDLGGGTFDVSILEIRGGIFEVLATSGDTYLGGEDFDSRILAHIVNALNQRHSVDLRHDRPTLLRLKKIVEQAKIDLSDRPEAEIHLAGLPPALGGLTELRLLLSVDVLNQLCEPLILRSIEICNRTMAEAGLSAADIDEAILIGGQTRMPRVMEMVGDLFHKQLQHQVDPDLAVAVGAAIQASNLNLARDRARGGAPAPGGQLAARRVCLIDVTPLSLGLTTVGGLVSRLVPRNAKVPTTVREIFTTVREDQDQVKIIVVQGESSKASENTVLGEMMLTGIRRAPAGIPKIEVTFNIDANGILNVSARDLDTNIEQSVRIEAHSGLSRDEIERLSNIYSENDSVAPAKRRPPG